MDSQKKDQLVIDAHLMQHEAEHRGQIGALHVRTERHGALG